jgi:CheY-like chemotaxis protein
MIAGSSARWRAASWSNTDSGWRRRRTASKAWSRASGPEFGPDEPLVIFCTTENEVAQISQALESGAQEYMMKPFDEEILVGKFAQIGLL